MSNVIAELMIKLGVDDGDVDSKLSGISSKLGKFGKVAGAAVAGAATAVGAVVKQSVSAYGEYQQLTGGVQKLYGNMGQSLEDYAKAAGKTTAEVKDEWQALEDAQNLVMKNAQNAYASSGMSVNEYLDTATSFSAALIGSLEGDTVEAAKMTDVAMRAMSDNFNTFGGDFEGISNAFKGFSKQNYTMLDNLKLGYGGTKQEMQRLIDDANLYAASIGEASDLTIENFADVVQAIELIQEKQNIAGTTAREAGETLAGSAGSAKAAWENLKVGLADDTADIDQLIENLVNSLTTMLSNTVPIVEKALSGVGTLIEKLAPVIAEKLPGLVEDLLPKLINAALSLIDGLVQALPTIISTLVKQIPTIVKSLITALTKAIPQLIKVGTELIKSLADGMGKGDGEVLDMIMDLINSLIDAILDNLPVLIEAGLTIVENLVLGIMEKLPDLIEAAADIVIKLVEGITEMLPQILEKGKDVILNIVHGITDNLPKIIQTAVDVIKTIVDTLIKNLPQILQTGMDILLELIQGLLDAIPDLVAMLPDIIDTIVTTLLSPEMLAKLLDVGVQLIAQLAEGLLDILVNIGDKADEIIGGIVDALLALAGSLLDAGAKLMEKFWEGLKEIAAEIYEWAKNFVDNIKAIFKEAKSISELGDTVMAKANQAQYLASQEYADAVAANRAKYSNTSSSKGYIPTSAQAAMKSAAVSNSSIPSSAREKMGYAKAMDTAYLLDGATIFGAMNGSLLEGGERGQEMIVGTDYLAGMIKEAYEQANSGKDQNIIIPVYIGQERITEVVVNAQNRHNYITGGR